MPSLTFSCNGRISGVTASMSALRASDSLPVFQVWHPLAPGSHAYSKVGQVQFENETRVSISEYFISNVSLSSLKNNQIEFQSGDVIGCYQPSNISFGIWWIRDISDTVYFQRFINNYTDVVINVSNYLSETGRPLISVMIGVYN